MNLKKYLFHSKNSKVNTINKFSIITASYNCGVYLEDYFSSILSQDYPKDMLEIILIDDGSTDNTVEVVDKFSSKLNIKYIFQENKGISSARNIGIENASNEYLSFIDADDYVSANYFKSINTSINVYPKASLFVSNLYYYFEVTKEIKNIHFLKYRFTKLKYHYQVDLMKNPEWFVLHMSSCVFKKHLINNKVREIKPQFEDVFFINEYLKDINKLVVFNNKAIYYYRKRKNDSSTIDQVGADNRRYLDLLEDGYLSLLQLYADDIPEYVKNVVNYDFEFNKKEFDELSLDLDLDKRNKLILLIEQYLKK